MTKRVSANDDDVPRKVIEHLFEAPNTTFYISLRLYLTASWLCCSMEFDVRR